MISPEMPADEQARLQTLHSIGLLDTAPEERFDRLTRLARRLFDVPIALVTLVDNDRQWFKSCDGLDVRETTREVSFCGHAILGDDVLVVEDARRDRRFADNPLVLGPPHIRFYTGYPLRYLDGSKLGTLCIIDNRPRQFGREDHRALKDLATLVQHELAAMELATLDELTGIPNRRGFSAFAEKALSMAARHGLATSLILFDLDQFKSINDRFGHVVGDRALKLFANHLRSIFRDSDVIARLGGDEFAVLLPDAAADVAHEAVARLRRSVTASPDEDCIGNLIRFSAGVVELEHGHGHTLLLKADSAMYACKPPSQRRQPTASSAD